MRLSLFLAVALLAGPTSGWAVAETQPTTAGSVNKATSDYVKLCQKVMAKTMPALKLPDIPDDYDDTNLSQKDRDTVDRATSLRFAAMVTAPIIA